MNDAELRKLALAATEGPWEHHKRTNVCSTVSSIGGPNHPDRPRAVCVNPHYGKTRFDKTDAAYIAAANPETIIELLDKLKAAEKLIDTLGETVDGFQTGFNKAGATMKVIGELQRWNVFPIGDAKYATEADGSDTGRWIDADNLQAILDKHNE